MTPEARRKELAGQLAHIREKINLAETEIDQAERQIQRATSTLEQTLARLEDFERAMAEACEEIERLTNASKSA